jgi:flagellar hook-associated protein 1 FlgK
MGLINQALQVGRSALLSYQSALQVIGNNISNAGSPDYTRQTPGLSSVNGPGLPEGMRPGAGVALTSLKRNLDEALENRLRAAIGETEAQVARQQALAQVEALFDASGGLQLAARTNEFFNAMSDVQNAPDDIAARQLAIATGTSLAESLRQMRRSLGDLGADFNTRIAGLVETANDLSERIAELNTEIVSAEASGSPASALRDQRDALIRDLSELLDVSVRPQANGAANVYIGNESLVDNGVSRGLSVMTHLDGEFERDEVVFADNSSRVAVGGGQLEGLIAARDEAAFGQIDGIDRLAAAVIFEVNKVHANGQGLTGYSTVTSSYAAADPAAPLNSSDAGLPFTPDNGSFYIATRDQATGAVVSHQIEIDLDGVGEDTTLESLAADISDNVSGVTATLTPDNRMTLSADPGLDFVFGFDGQVQRDDTSNVLAALGINTFFDGVSATDIEVNTSLSAQPSLLSAAAVNLSGDGVMAGRLAEVGQQESALLDNQSILEFYGSLANAVAVSGASARENAETSANVRSALQAQKENISGVSLDEEAVELLKFERAFQGASRFVSVVDRLTGELIALVR